MHHKNLFLSPCKALKRASSDMADQWILGFGKCFLHDLSRINLRLKVYFTGDCNAFTVKFIPVCNK